MWALSYLDSWAGLSGCGLGTYVMLRLSCSASLMVVTPAPGCGEAAKANDSLVPIICSISWVTRKR